MTHPEIRQDNATAPPKPQQQSKDSLPPIPTLKSFLKDVFESTSYKSLFLGLVYLNMVILIIEADLSAGPESNRALPSYVAYRVLNMLFMSVYLIELLLKVYLSPLGYWKSGYNVIDAFVVGAFVMDWIVSFYFSSLLGWNLTVFRVISGLRGLRAIRIIPHFRPLEVVVNTLLNTMKTNVLDVLVLLFLVIFVFAVVGHYLFGDNRAYVNSYPDWATLGDAFYTLWIFVCVTFASISFIEFLFEK